MHHDVDCTAHGLVFRQGIGQLRIHDGKPAARRIVVGTTFQIPILVGDD
ncbi:hypothetical protein SDC9_195522 [bioreactor metagenome]|uniref:Uncharacterized protein n=1 Tax=bioreactor metagenome TaxID=1076179 RepID=A0A645I9J0_9ZZZZ